MPATKQCAGIRTLADLLISENPQFAAIDVHGIQLDSRKIQPGDVFLAVAGEVHDGRQFIEQAVADGAVAVIAESPVSGFVDEMTVPVVEVPELGAEVGQIAARFYGQPSSALYMVGITGTNGKTTTSALVAQLCRGLGDTCGVIGTLGASLDSAPTEAKNTTPDPVTLQSYLADWRDQGVESVAMEVSSHALVQGRVSGVQFDTAVFTNLSQDHLDYHGSMDSYGRAKLQLFRAPGLRNAIVNLDDEYADSVLAAIPAGVRIVTYSVQGKPADVVFEQLSFHSEGVAGKLRTPWGEGDCSSPLQGVFNLSNLAAALSVLFVNGAEFGALLAVVNTLVSVPGRMELVTNNQGLQVVVDYAHTPDALDHVLRALRPHVSGSLITVFGCGGDRDRGKRSIMGRIASEQSDLVVVTSDNPRTENPQAIVHDIVSGCTGSYELCIDRAEAIELALSRAQAGDCVVIAGKGHENYQIIDDERLPFSDVQQARLALSGRPQ
ncbi:MAG: UDP-N-acetylmuramoyl-L-alanyl-D-glutamate--2,6-diaminopimelate ligase [Halioglobus sp.]